MDENVKLFPWCLTEEAYLENTPFRPSQEQPLSVPASLKFKSLDIAVVCICTDLIFVFLYLYNFCPLFVHFERIFPFNSDMPFVFGLLVAGSIFCLFRITQWTCCESLRSQQLASMHQQQLSCRTSYFPFMAFENLCISSTSNQYA